MSIDVAGHRGAVIWRGEYTGHWWALHPAVPAFIEAVDERQLAARIDAALGTPAAVAAAPARVAAYLELIGEA